MYMMIAHYDNYQYYMLMQEYTAMIARYTSRLYISFMPTMFESHTYIYTKKLSSDWHVRLNLASTVSINFISFPCWANGA